MGRGGDPSDGATSGETTEPESKAEPEPGEAGGRLRDAVDKKVSKECTRIAKALVDKTIAGNLTGVKLVVELTGAKSAARKRPRKRPGPSLAQQWALEPQWTGPLPGEEAIDPQPSETAL
jgi:hypothetical protein